MTLAENDQTGTRLLQGIPASYRDLIDSSHQATFLGDRESDRLTCPPNRKCRTAKTCEGVDGGDASNALEKRDGLRTKAHGCSEMRPKVAKWAAKSKPSFRPLNLPEHQYHRPFNSSRLITTPRLASLCTTAGPSLAQSAYQFSATKTVAVRQHHPNLASQRCSVRPRLWCGNIPTCPGSLPNDQGTPQD